MIPKTEDQFRAEMEEARQALDEREQKISVSDRASEESGINCDFELPYSSLATIQTSRWN